MPDVVHQRQRGCPDIVPGLTQKPWWEREDFEWVAKLEEQKDVITEELMNLRKVGGFQPYRGPTWAGKVKPEDEIGSKSNDSGDWNVYYLYLHDLKFDENCK